jgi:hypothetical protein
MHRGESSCKSCSHYKQIGEKGFCFKQNKVLSSSQSCDDFSLKIDEDMKKRWLLEKKDERKAGALIEGVNNIKVEVKPEGSEEFSLKKKSKVKEKRFIDTEGGDKITSASQSEEYKQGQNLFLAIIVGGLIILIIVLYASGVL